MRCVRTKRVLVALNIITMICIYPVVCPLYRNLDFLLQSNALEGPKNCIHDPGTCVFERMCILSPSSLMANRLCYLEIAYVLFEKSC